MIAYEQAQHIPFHDPEQHFGYQQKLGQFTSGCTYSSLDRSRSAIDGLRTPLLELQDTCSPHLRNSSYLNISRRHMQSFPGSSQRTDSNQSSRSGIEQNVVAQDSGLGITQDGSIFGSTYQTSGMDQPSYLSYDQTGSAASDHVPKLASPFHDEERTPAMSWNSTYPGSALSDGYQTAYTSTPNHHFLAPEHRQLGPQYTMSPAEFTPNSLQYGNWQHGHIRTPAIRHDSTSTAVPHSTNFSYATPDVEASPFQWTPESATPDWQDTTRYLSNSSDPPAVMLDYSACNGADQGLQFVQPQQSVRTIMTVPQKRKPHLRPSLSESCVPRLSSSARMRAASMGHFLQAPPYHHYTTSATTQQLPLPPLPPSMLINTNQLQHSSSILPETPAPSHRHSQSCSSTPVRRKRPSSPPPSDFVNTNMPYLVPIRQEPTFPGDLYTPRYKRRTPNGRWEGWCGYCQPGRWLDLKNSRFWEDKLRNHGICAKTKMRFTEPEQIRWVTADGSVIPEKGLGLENGDPFLDQRKREGLCGTCNSWVGMDGLRTKARDRAVGWWMHAYKCHDHEKAMEQQAAVS